MTEFDSNTFEHDYIAGMLEAMQDELSKGVRSPYVVMDKYAVALTAFMNGQIVQAVKNRANTPKSDL